MEARVVWDDEVAGSSPVTPTTTLPLLASWSHRRGGRPLRNPLSLYRPVEERRESLPPPYRVRGRLQPSPVEERGESPSPIRQALNPLPSRERRGSHPHPVELGAGSQSSPVEGEEGGVTLTPYRVQALLSRQGRGGRVRATWLCCGVEVYQGGERPGCVESMGAP